MEFIRATGSVVDQAVTSGLEADALATTDAVVVEVLAGAGTEERAAQLRSLLGRTEFVPQEPMADAESAARLFRSCRLHGRAPRSQIDCLIAAVAIRRGVPVLHQGRDFGVIAEHSTLQLVRP